MKIDFTANPLKKNQTKKVVTDSKAIRDIVIQGVRFLMTDQDLKSNRRSGV